MRAGFLEGLRARREEGFLPVIPDIKVISPKEGPLLPGISPADAARRMEALGAPAISVVTEPKDFGGSLSLLEQVAAAVRIPVLRKDFLTGPQDLRLTLEAGATAVLLICACLSRDVLESLYRESLRLGLEPLVEAHTPEELAFAGSLGAKLVGVNNRDIRRLERDGGTVSTTRALAAGKPKGAFLVSESGISGPADARAAREAGADAILVGTAIWKAASPEGLYQDLQTAGGKTHEAPAH